MTKTAVLALAAALLAAAPALADAPAAPSAQATVAGPPIDTPGAVAMLSQFDAGAKPIVSGNNAALVLKVGGGPRSQTVMLSGAVYTQAGIPVREISSFAYKFSGAIDPALALALLQQTDNLLPRASWAVTNDANGIDHYVIYEGFIPTTADAETIHTLVASAGIAADKVEEELTGKDVW
jgi:hypothetical protein